MGLKVLKFGGTSVGTKDSLRNVKSIVDSLAEPAIVVVSALGGLTDRLIATASMAADGNPEYVGAVESFRVRHQEIIDALVPSSRRDEVMCRVMGLMDELADVYKGLSLIRSVPERTLDLVVSYGERMSSVIVAGLLQNAEHHDSLEIMRTERWFNKDIADRKLTEANIKAEYALPLQRTAVMGGFISRDKDTGEITNLGRGGSDYTAALVAAALDAESLEIWTDVDGFMTSDPRVIKSARIIPSMSFVESMELCSYGAKVIYPPTIYPVFHKNIPIKILNTFNPDAPGTFISDGYNGDPRVIGVSAMSNISMITVHGSLASNVAAINTRAYNALARNGIGVLLVAQPDTETSFSIALTDKEGAAGLKHLVSEFTPDIQSGDVNEIANEESLTIIAVVGESIKKIYGLGARLVNTLQRNGIEVKAISNGASDTTIALVVKSEVAPKALNLVHEAAIG